MKGRGTSSNPPNQYLKNHISRSEITSIDDWVEEDLATEYIKVYPKTIVNKVDSPDLSFMWNMNPYQGCEHGCIYCYARNTFEYWGYSAGLDFEQKILIKEKAPELLKKFLRHPKWNADVISLSGNTDCYQPAEKKFELTKGLLEVCNSFNQPVMMITKNAGILRDIKILEEMARKNLVAVMITITSLEESLRLKMEPRTVTAKKRLQVIAELAKHNIPVGVMVAPIIPGLNDHEIPKILEAAAEAGAQRAGYSIIRLQGAVQIIFREWLQTHFTDKAQKVLNLIDQNQGKGTGVRFKGSGSMATMIAQIMEVQKRKLGITQDSWNLDGSLFRRNDQLSLF
ncbi:PA0069 family radical SAM protein [Gynurincola endophyticus]|jgi:DNA repair photolyase|uniref:PA0069 family radical SAM protein n=1 Tax=Gynurincola endophyticus TaxID=2479004 RepID=UPI000F8EE286|nr:PA0069 family radical SAM protein [Gynurincola endophyticus]